jgi:hypothetical protein
VTVQERVLRVELAGGDGDGGVPALDEADVLGVSGARSERGLAVAHLQVVRDVAFWATGDDLGDPDRSAALSATSARSASIHSRER